MTATLGLCPTCSCSPDCSLRNGSMKTVWECEEFGSPVVPAPASLDDVSIASNVRRSQTPSRNGDRAEGLCCNCENHDGCMLRPVEGGVWHCESYR